VFVSPALGCRDHHRHGGFVSFLNPVAQSLTGWTLENAAAFRLKPYFKIINEETPADGGNPAIRALREGMVVGLRSYFTHCQNGVEIRLTTAPRPIRNAKNEVAGVVLVFRDITETQRQEHLVQILSLRREHHSDFARTIHRSDRICGSKRRIEAFYQTFDVSLERRRTSFILRSGQSAVDIPALRTLLTEVLSNNHPIHDTKWITTSSPSGARPCS